MAYNPKYLAGYNDSTQLAEAILRRSLFFDVESTEKGKGVVASSFYSPEHSLVQHYVTDPNTDINKVSGWFKRQYNKGADFKSASQIKKTFEAITSDIGLPSLAPSGTPVKEFAASVNLSNIGENLFQQSFLNEQYKRNIIGWNVGYDLQTAVETQSEAFLDKAVRPYTFKTKTGKRKEFSKKFYDMPADLDIAAAYKRQKSLIQQTRKAPGRFDEHLKAWDDFFNIWTDAALAQDKQVVGILDAQDLAKSVYAKAARKGFLSVSPQDAYLGSTSLDFVGRLFGFGPEYHIPAADNIYTAKAVSKFVELGGLLNKSVLTDQEQTYLKDIFGKIQKFKQPFQKIQTAKTILDIMADPTTYELRGRPQADDLLIQHPTDPKKKITTQATYPSKRFAGSQEEAFADLNTRYRLEGRSHELSIFPVLEEKIQGIVETGRTREQAIERLRALTDIEQENLLKQMDSTTALQEGSLFKSIQKPVVSHLDDKSFLQKIAIMDGEDWAKQLKGPWKRPAVAIGALALIGIGYGAIEGLHHKAEEKSRWADGFQDFGSGWKGITTLTTKLSSWFSKRGIPESTGIGTSALKRAQEARSFYRLKTTAIEEEIARMQEHMPVNYDAVMKKTKELSMWQARFNSADLAANRAAKPVDYDALMNRIEGLHPGAKFPESKSLWKQGFTDFGSGWLGLGIAGTTRSGNYPNDPHPELHPSYNSAKDVYLYEMFRASSIGLSEEEIYKEMTTGKKPVSEYVYSTAQAGTAEHRYLQGLWYKKGIIKQAEILVGGPEWGISGHIDALTTNDIILDPKTLSPGRWATLKGRGKPYEKHMCLSPNTKIRTENGIKQLKDIKVGDKVLTHERNYKAVLGKAFVEHTQLVTLKVTGSFERIQGSLDHKLFAVQKKSCNINKSFCFPYKFRDSRCNGCSNNTHSLIPRKTSLRDLQVGDVLAYPLATLTQKENFETTAQSLINNLKTTHQSQPLAEKFDLRDFAWIVGYYLAEGSCTERQVQFSFHIKETSYTEHLQELIQRIAPKATFCIHEKIESNCRVLQVTSSKFAELILTYAGKVEDKFIHSLFYDKTLLPLLLAGYFRGDGHIYPSGEKVAISTHSQRLAYSLYDCFLALRIPFSNSKVEKENPIVFGRQINKTLIAYRFDFINYRIKEIVNLAWPDVVLKENLYKKKLYNTMIFTEKYALLKIQTKETKELKEPICLIDIEVEDDKSFCLQGVASSNSQVNSYMGFTGLTDKPAYLIYTRQDDPSKQLFYPVKFDALKFQEDIAKVERVRNRVKSEIESGILDKSDLPKTASWERLQQDATKSQQELNYWANNLQETWDVYQEELAYNQAQRRGIPFNLEQLREQRKQEQKDSYFQTVGLMAEMYNNRIQHYKY